MEITDEIIEAIYKRAKQYSISRWNEEPDRIELDEHGTITLRYINYCCGSTEEDTREISAGSLSTDLDQLVKEREEEQAKKLEEERIRREREARIKDEREKNERRAQFLALKREFEP